MSPELVLAIAGFITAIITAGSSYLVSKRAAKKDEVVLLREEVERLQQRVNELSQDNDKWRDKYDELHQDILILRQENAWLKMILAKNNITIPEMPKEYHIE